MFKCQNVSDFQQMDRQGAIKPIPSGPAASITSRTPALRPNIGRSAPRFAIPKAAMLEATILLPLLGAERPLPRLAT